ncbi:MAG: helix-turn-helix domain-containing protein [Lachnospiraceae bacterium]|nr:helix-turn-helix domain-containing protein [Lachnospiraceae bacterium]
MSLIRAGERLNLHKNTLQYRLDRIYKRCGYNPRAFQDAVVLYTALRL